MRREFTGKVMAEAAARAQGHCDGCTRRLMAGDYHYDHIIPDALGGEPLLSNCQVLCRSCHSVKTTKADVPRIAKAKRNFKKARDIHKPRSITQWRRFDGSIRKAGRARHGADTID